MVVDKSKVGTNLYAVLAGARGLTPEDPGPGGVDPGRGRPRPGSGSKILAGVKTPTGSGLKILAGVIPRPGSGSIYSAGVKPRAGSGSKKFWRVWPRPGSSQLGPKFTIEITEIRLRYQFLTKKR